LRFCDLHCFVARSDDNVDVNPDQFGRKLRETVELPVCKSVLDEDVFSLNIPKFSEAVPKNGYKVIVVLSRIGRQKTHSRDVFGFLRFDWVASNAEQSAETVASKSTRQCGFCLADHLITLSDIGRNHQTDLLSGLHLYGKLKCRRLLYWQLGRFAPFKIYERRSRRSALKGATLIDAL
jgi:hypothetical protein